MEVKGGLLVCTSMLPFGFWARKKPGWGSKKGVPRLKGGSPVVHPVCCLNATTPIPPGGVWQLSGKQGNHPNCQLDLRQSSEKRINGNTCGK